MSQVISALPLPELYYQSGSRAYWRRDSRGRFITVDRDGAKKFLARSGYSATADRSELSDADRAVLDIQETQNVAYAAPLAGHEAGLHVVNGDNVLVTNSPTLIAAREGDWPLLAQILEGMFVADGLDQRPYLFGWLKLSIGSVQDRTWSPGQVLAIAGPVRAGKSLLQTLITELLGGRSANPYQFMTGATNFNADLFGAEHLVVDDQAESTNIAQRRHFAAQIKQITASPHHRCHPKGLTAVTLDPIWRMTISLNDEPERLHVLPPLDADIADKIMLLRANRVEMPMPTRSSGEQSAFRAALRAELPGFVHFLQGHSIPVDLQSPRFGIATFHHPALVQALAETTPEARLLELINSVLFELREPSLLSLQQAPTDWTGSAADLHAVLTDHHRFGAQARDLLKSVNTCGTYLHRLQRQEGDRLTSRILHGTRHYTISPPAEGGGVE